MKDTGHSPGALARCCSRHSRARPQTQTVRHHQIFLHTGFDIGRRPDGQLELFVVNHGARESMQLFSISVRHDGAALQWRGCVEVDMMSPPCWTAVS
jgi:hypothetical protein